MKLLIAALVMGGWLWLIELWDIGAKLRKFQRKLGVGTPVKFKVGSKWRFGEVSSLHGDTCRIDTETEKYWRLRKELWPIQEWDRDPQNIEKPK